MKFSAPYEAFKTAVSLVNAVQTGTALVSICKHILIEANADNQTVTLTKTDLETQHTATIKVQVEEGGKATTEGDNLAKVLNTYENIKRSDDFNVVVQLEENRISYRFTDNKKHKPIIMASDDPDVFPEIDPFGEEVVRLRVIADHLVDYVTKAMLSIKKHDSKRENSGAYFILTGPNLEVAATNRTEMSSIKVTPLEVTYAGAVKNAFGLVPRKTLEAITRTVGGAEGVNILFSSAQVDIQGVTDGINYSIRNATVDVPAPLDTSGTIPKDAETVLKLPVPALKNTLAHIDAIMERTITNKINLLFDPQEPDIVTLSCKTTKGEVPGIAVEAKVEKLPSKDAVLILPDKKLFALLKAIKSQEIKVSFTKTGQACTFQGSDEDHFTFVVASLKAVDSDNLETKPVKIEAPPIEEDVENFEDIMIEDISLADLGDEIEI